jgi:hypothetical protein
MLLAARAGGVSFQQTLTIGRQELYLHRSELTTLQSDFPHLQQAGPAEFLRSYRSGDYVDDFCRQALGCESLTALDYAGHEGATLLHDLNRPVPAEWHEQYDAVIDGGSLEHVFHFPTAIASVMQMAKVGGSVFLSLPANNHCGHGFYQFSPELMYRVFSPANGFEVHRVTLVEAPYPSPELTVNRAAYDVVDPATVGCRVGLMSRGPVMMLVWARRTAALLPFEQPPLQSDYQSQWQPGDKTAPPRSVWRRLVSAVYRSLPQGWQNRINGHLQRRRFSFSNRACYRHRGQ